MQNNINISNHISENLILVAEDDDLNFELLYYILSKMNYKVIRALNGKQAVNMFSNTPEVDLVLTDLSMPVMDGIEATRQIREINKEIPIIVQSGLTEFNIMDRAREAGCNCFITKPINRNDLLIQIKECINSRSSQSHLYKFCG